MESKILLGDNPLIGVDHLSRQRARERRDSTDVARGINVLQMAIKGGGEGFCFSTHPTSYAILRELKVKDLCRGLKLYPLLPYAMGYVRLATEKGIPGLFRYILGHLNWSDRLSLLVRGGKSAVQLEPLELFKFYLNMELSIVKNIAPKESKIEVVFMHEILTDACVNFDVIEPILMYKKYISSRWGAAPGYVTRNLPKFIQMLNKYNVHVNDIVIMTPVNACGFQMPPSLQSYEEAIKSINDGHIVAISILAGGFLSLKDGIDYLNKIPNIESICVGTANPEHALATFNYIKEHWVKSKI